MYKCTLQNTKSCLWHQTLPSSFCLISDRTFRFYLSSPKWTVAVPFSAEIFSRYYSEFLLVTRSSFSKSWRFAYDEFLLKPWRSPSIDLSCNGKWSFCMSYKYRIKTHLFSFSIMALIRTFISNRRILKKKLLYQAWKVYPLLTLRIHEIANNLSTYNFHTKILFFACGASRNKSNRNSME